MCMFLFVHLFVCVSVFLRVNSKSTQSWNKTFEKVAIYENSLYKCDIGHCQIKVKVTVGL